ncbi:MAG: Crp/Fnr family transcriptional regulator [Clostridia bacterium]|nr:Crp/Fnr family transcriptional regulator [Clostridia bacterium]
MREYLPILKEVSLFYDIGEDELFPMLDCLGGAARRYPKGAFVFRAGEPARQVGIVLTGQVQVSREDADGNRLLLAAIGPGGMFAEAYACARAPSLPVAVTASAECRILLLDCAKILTPCSSACPFHARLISNLMEVLAQKNIMLSRKLEHLSKRTLREKLLSYLGEQSSLAGSRSFTIPFDRQALADYLCADRSALSRELGNLQRSGVLKADRNHFKLLNFHKEAES